MHELAREEPNCYDKLSCQEAVVKSRDVLNFWQINVNISIKVEDRNILTMED